MSVEFRNFWIGALSTVAGWAIVKLLESYKLQKDVEKASAK